MTRGTQRPAVTLMEVLLAIFILSVGMVSIMACFPIGVMNMVRSVRDQRSAQLTGNSNTMLHAWWKDSWQTNDGLIMPENIVSLNSLAIAALDTDPIVGPSSEILRVDSGPSHPVFIDPMGLLYSGGIYGPTVANIIYRAHLSGNYSTAANPRLARRICTLPDDMTFDESGLAKDLSSQIDRGYRYSCAWLIQREHNSNPYDVRVFTLTFDNRPIDLPDGDQWYSSALGAVSANPISDPYYIQLMSPANNLPKTRKGGWIMVAYQAKYPVVGVTPSFKPDRWVISFHRTISQDDAAAGGNVTRTLGLEQPLKTPSGTGAVAGEVRVVVFEKLIEVFDRGTVSVTDRGW